MNFLLSCHTFQPRPCTLLVFLVGVLAPKLHTHRQVVRRMMFVRDDFARWNPRKDHVKHLQLTAEILNDVDPALSCLRDGRGSCGHLTCCPQKWVHRISLYLPHTASNAADLAEMLRIQIAKQDYWRICYITLTRKLSEPLHELGDLPHSNHRLSAVFRVSGEVCGNHNQRIATGLPPQKHEETDTIALRPPLSVIAVLKVQCNPRIQVEFGPPPEDTTTVQ
mmetsp:Transcript_45530/g.120818  ORF Transcript_45530/g.120818 Transcript_45530/m.120818 type:complete len:222 (-) Transcript_45530:761-1426(-)